MNADKELRRELVEILGRSAELHPVQRCVVMGYALLSPPSGTVRKTGEEMAELLGMTAPGFSRTRRELVQLGWLEETDRAGNIRYYRLTEKGTGRQVVVQLRAQGS